MIIVKMITCLSLRPCNELCSNMTSLHPPGPKPAFQRFPLSFFTVFTPPLSLSLPPHLPLHPSPPLHSVQFSSRLIRAGGARFSPEGGEESRTEPSKCRIM